MPGSQASARQAVWQAVGSRSMSMQRYEAIVGSGELVNGHRFGRTRRAASKTELLIRDLAGQIEQGVLKPGDRLPSARELCQRYRVSAIVVRRAVGWLKAAGLVVGVAGVGVFVAGVPGGGHQ